MKLNRNLNGILALLMIIPPLLDLKVTLENLEKCRDSIVKTLQNSIEQDVQKKTCINPNEGSKPDSLIDSLIRKAEPSDDVKVWNITWM